MGMVVRSNIMALNANRQLGMNNSSVSKNLEKLSSGFKINRAGDDASGLAISEKMKAQIKGLDAAAANAQDGISLVQTAEGALTEVHDMLNRMVELAEKSANGTMEVGANGLAGTDRQALQDEMDQLSTEIDRIAKSTNFNNIKLLDGTLGGGAAGGTNTAPPSGTLDNTSVTKLGAFEGFTFDNNATDEMKDAFNKALDDGVDLSFVLASATKMTITGLPPEYSLFFEDAKGTETAATGDITVGTSAGNINKAAMKFTIKDADSNIIGTFSLGTPTGTLAAGTTKLTLKAGDPDAITDAPTIETKGTDNIGLGDLTFAYASGATNEQKQALLDAFKDATDIKFNMSGTAGSSINTTTSKLTVTGVPSGYKFIVTDAAKGEKDLSTDGIANGAGSGKLDLTKAFTITIQDDKGNDVATLSVKAAARKGGDTTFTIQSPASAAGAANGLILQIGDSNDSYNKMTVSVQDMQTNSLFSGTDLQDANGNATTKKIENNTVTSFDISDQTKAGTALSAIKKVINTVSSQRAKLGAIQNRLDHTINNLDVASENMNAANSRIRDTDMAKQMMDYTKMNVLTQAAQAMLAQANQQPQSILQLLQ